MNTPSDVLLLALCDVVKAHLSGDLDDEQFEAALAHLKGEEAPTNE